MKKQMLQMLGVALKSEELASELLTQIGVATGTTTVQARFPATNTLRGAVRVQPDYLGSKES